MFIKTKLLRMLFVGVASAGLLAACGGSDDDSADDRLSTADPKVRFVHAVPGAPNVTLQRNGTNETGATDVAYKYASQYYDVRTENYTFTLRTATGAVELATDAFTADRGDRYTLVALPTDSGVELLRISDPYNKSVASNNARLRVLNAAANTAAFDVYVTAVDADLANEAADLSSVGYKVVKPATREDSIDFEGGTYRVRLTAANSKTAFFNAVVAVPQNGDWLLIALPETETANSVRLLLVRADDSADATDEIISE